MKPACMVVDTGNGFIASNNALPGIVGESIDAGSAVDAFYLAYAEREAMLRHRNHASEAGCIEARLSEYLRGAGWLRIDGRWTDGADWYEDDVFSLAAKQFAKDVRQA